MWYFQDTEIKKASEIIQFLEYTGLIFTISSIFNALMKILVFHSHVFYVKFTTGLLVLQSHEYKVLRDDARDIYLKEFLIPS